MRELERLLGDLRVSLELRTEVDCLDTGAEALMVWANSKGYNLDAAEAEELSNGRRELSDDELDKVAGGEDAWGGTGGASGTGGTGGGGTTPPP